MTDTTWMSRLRRVWNQLELQPVDRSHKLYKHAGTLFDNFLRQSLLFKTQIRAVIVMTCT
jgi:hypothetical protein